MDVSAPYETVVPTLDGPVLVALAKLAAPVTGRQAHKLAGTGSEAGVRLVLNRLVSRGIVTMSTAGNARLYQANREHIAWPVVEELANLRGELLTRLRQEFATWDLRPRSVALFGSAARGDGDIYSDIDVLIVRDRDTDDEDEYWLAQVDRLRRLVAAWTGNNAQIFDIGSGDLERHIAARDELAEAWQRDAVPISGEDIREVLRDLELRRGRSRSARSRA